MLKNILSGLSVLLYLLGGLLLGLGIYFAIEDPSLAQEYFGKKSGQMIDKGIYYLLTAMVLHFLIQIKNTTDEILEKLDR